MNVIKENNNSMEGIEIVVVDFGNSCWVNKHFTKDIQTRHYRSFEAIIGARYGTAVDMWSVACIVWELMTGDLLFAPKGGRKWDKTDDHLARIEETLGPIPNYLTRRGNGSDFYNRKGELKYIKHLRPWSLEDVLVEKYGWKMEEAVEFGAFLRPMMEYDCAKRVTAFKCKSHPWLIHN
eukprot:TRINITY_DN1424_c0_g1_i4.p1 TRINITY_DN1424_c0_g1~~TRINITY_DN1424_c0_g1_i4.p1  ORF type:complete len:179 (+),score=48.91 TRINITY_DN1424_c0_g1_i4:523-1059(+)